MQKADIGQKLVEAVKGDFKVAQEALDGAKAVDDLVATETDTTKKQELMKLRERFIKLSDGASTNATVITSLGPAFTRSST
jgi:hypothetical protein